MKLNRWTAGVLFALVSPLALGPQVAHAHAHLTRSEPRDGGTVTPPPHKVSLWFTQGLEQSFSSVEVRDASGARVDDGEAQVKDNTMQIGLKALPPGTYKVLWRALSVDTHKTDGTFTFQVTQ